MDPVESRASRASTWYPPNNFLSVDHVQYFLDKVKKDQQRIKHAP